MYAHKSLRSVLALSLLALVGCSLEEADSYGTTRQALSDGGADMAPEPRLKPISLTVGGNTIGVTGTFYDTLLATSCRPGLMADGTKRCIPIGTEESNIRYVDGSCATPALLFTLKTCSSKTGQYVVPMRDAPANLCSAGLRVPAAIYQVGSKTSLPVLMYTNTSMGCLSTTTSTTFWSDYEIYNITPIAASALAEVGETH